MGEEFHFGPEPESLFPGREAAGEEPAAFSRRARRRWTNAPALHCFLFFVTLLTTLIVGAHIALNYENSLPAFDWDFSLGFFTSVLGDPATLMLGAPFSFTLLSILLAHEMGHYFTCRYYGIEATYPYFIPAPTLIGTMGAFIRIKSPIPTRRALFDVGISGPLAGVIVAIPALALATLQARAGAPVALPDTIRLGTPLAIVLLGKFLNPGVNPAAVAFEPLGCAAWVGLFATALNLIPIGQLDGGHVLYAVLGERHRAISRGLLLALLPLGVFCWAGWVVWAVILLVVGVRHPLVMYPLEPLDKPRKSLAVLAALILLFTFVPTPFAMR
jgi:membrane-associated protease RseP (regulator of RpoE activity)